MCDEPLPLIEAMETAIREEAATGAPVNFYRLEASMHNTRRELGLSGQDNMSAWVDAVAFGLDTDHFAEPWQRYFGPKGARSYEDGTVEYIPDVHQLDERALDLWSQRLDVVDHPAFRARYSDLLWEIAPQLGRRRDPVHARTALAAYELMIAESAYEEFFDKTDAALRMLTLALSIRDEDAKVRSRELLMEEFRELMGSSHRFNFDIVERLLWERNVGTPEITQEVVGALDAALEQSAGEGDRFNAHSARDIGTRLKRHYNGLRSRADVVRVHTAVARAFETLAARSEPMAAAAHLDVAATEYRNAGDEVAFNRVRTARAEAVARSNVEMVAHSFRFEVGVDDMERFLDSIVTPENLGLSLANIANEFVPRISVLRERVLENARVAPIQATISINIHEDEHIAAVVGSVDEDMEGRIMHQAGQEAMFVGIFLDQALERCMSVHGLDSYEIAGWANRLGAFDDLTMVIEGVEAWRTGDWIKTLHVLVPQIELGLRRTLRGLGEPIVRNHPTMPGRQTLLNMGEVLSNPVLQTALGDDTVHYFRALYVDPRARNLRNVVAHGLTGMSDATSTTCDRIIHSLLVLGFWRDIARAASSAASRLS
ncbi:hypothetical protein DSM25558_2826 [Agrobacterium sp. DSM 25558]|uniref:DUF4209 domain-containing protein n=1 Tax=Agrobacterium sp. DSM 25558 TaxID=1907665 RepID=UPI0009724047|nr:DUF4209 domain-containing protein [Agrobacterium sp. DSM 25558]SCX21018.1 hypothetical protein DSM25558_2826 [Agrobacterium sp. DSM 25558]